MNLSRRNFLRWTVGLSLWLIQSTVWGKTCLRDQTLEQGLGPFFPDRKDPVFPIREDLDLDLPWIEANDHDLTFVNGSESKAEGQVINLRGRCFDENCQPINGAKILLWQASSSGRYNHQGDNGWIQFQDPRNEILVERKHDPFFQYWGHAITGGDGGYFFKTIIPGFYPADLRSGWFRPPHLHFMVQAKGYSRLTTQTYFRGAYVLDHEWIQNLNDRDYVLRGEGSLEEQNRLIVEYKPDPKVNDELVGEFDFHLKKSKSFKSFFNLE